MEKLINQYGKTVFLKLDSPNWQELLNLLVKEFEHEQYCEHPFFTQQTEKGLEDSCLFMSYVVFAKRILDIRESLLWRRQALGEEFTLYNIFWTVTERLVPVMEKDLQDNPLAYLRLLTNLQVADKPINKGNYGQTGLIKDYNQALVYLGCKNFISLCPSDSEIKNILNRLENLYKESLVLWAKKYKLVNQKNIALQWCIECAKQRTKSWVHSDPTTEWSSGIKVSNAPFLSRDEEDFNFHHIGWHPGRKPFMSQKNAKEAITKAFNKYLEQYLEAKQIEDQQLLRNEERDLHTIWLVRHRILGHSWQELQKAHPKNDGSLYSKANIYKGIETAGKELMFLNKTINKKKR
jgi:hypothetical protein